MSEPRDESSPLDAAAEAAGAGDFQSAERHLNHAVELEEARFGPMHPDLANILNNLGVVYEHLDKPAKAESCYRRAHAIATAVLPPNDPAVVMSAKNLRDFCSARGIPFEPLALPVAPAPAAPQVTSAPVAPISARASDRAPTRPASVGGEAAPQSAIAPRTLGIVALMVFGLIVGAIVIATRSRSTSHEPVAPAPAASAPSREPATSSATPAPPTPAPAADLQVPARPSPPPEGGQQATRPEARHNTPEASAPTPTIVSAQLCRAIETGNEWHCTPVSGALEPGPVFFYTRLTSPSDTKVEHRWYRGELLQQKTTLQIHANQGTGYRTYSRTTVSVDRTGEWRVELRAMDGSVLHEERFTVGRH